ncbi:hypothetical protein Plut_0815 [Pelodictyon luteolum DSM 273]|uniref:Uncharacterized protein n=1 Tax=Chlorobium luteolum (strain DSM 273 / BCRC 81028 / 2530) TaxID=319225 RepID=Q3B4P7_CHLL3|nr:hypothetical protein Plut_0815 [Pelodictyon luteolum DSM 273]
MDITINPLLLPVINGNGACTPEPCSGFTAILQRNRTAKRTRAGASACRVREARYTPACRRIPCTDYHGPGTILSVGMSALRPMSPLPFCQSVQSFHPQSKE